MSDYQSIDLSSFCNAGPEFYGERTPPIGTQSFHVLPFQIGPPEAGAGPCFVGFDAERTQAITVRLDAAARRILFAHTLLESEIPEGDPVGRVIARYVFRFANGEEVRVPIRERFEIGS